MNYPRWCLTTSLAFLALACSDGADDTRAPGTAGGTGSAPTGGTPSGGSGGSGGGAPGGAPTGGGGSAAGMPSMGGAGAAGQPGGGSAGTGGGAGSGGSGGMPMGGSGGAGGAGGSGGSPGLPDPGTEGDGDFSIGPNPPGQADLSDRGNKKGKSFSFSMRLADSKIFDGKDSTLDPNKVSASRSINVYVPDKYKDGDPAPVLIIQDGPGEINQVKNALDNLTVSTDEKRKLPPFVVIAVQNGGNDAIGSERGLEYDTLSDRYARFIDQEVMPAVASNTQVKQAYPNLKFTQDPSGRATLGCSSGGAAAFTMAWFRPDLFSRVIAYSTTLVAQQDPKAPESKMYPLGAWEYHSSLKLIEADKTMLEKKIRVFLNVNENDLRSGDAESTHHNWVMANQRSAAALKAKGFHYRFVLGKGAGHCDGGIRSGSLADALVWAWRGYEPSGK